ncbi:hypothetical protein ERO13_A08G043725v2 [Gossypium hirsutum]|nr:hypothetical protein ERO13_A08G043725v2 [Gossypium hirsutum]
MFFFAAILCSYLNLILVDKMTAKCLYLLKKKNADRTMFLDLALNSRLHATCFLSTLV